MYHKGLSREQVVMTAVRLIEECGREKFTLHALAAELGIKTASLYKHISGMDDLITEVGRYAFQLQKQEHELAIAGKTGDEAVFALGRAYRKFATEHYELYKLTFVSRSINEVLRRETEVMVEPYIKALEGYPLSDEQKQHWQRIFRSLMHGFFVHEKEGYFHFFAVDKEDTFELALRLLVDAIKRELM